MSISTIWASWACEITNYHIEETTSVILCVRISVTSQAKLATITSSHSCCKRHLIKRLPVRVHIV